MREMGSGMGGEGKQCTKDQTCLQEQKKDPLRSPLLKSRKGATGFMFKKGRNCRRSCIPEERHQKEA